jgi:hypothetical protein
MVVYKYPMEIKDIVELELPAGAEILHVEAQNDKLCLWALVDPEKPTLYRRIRIAGTGHTIKENIIRYINTFTLYEKALWFHVFEI